MTRWATLAIAFLLSTIATVQYTDTASGQAGGGWTVLFDGKNLDHWDSDNSATFKIEDGAVIATDKKDPKATASYLISKKSYKNFIVRAEFWVSDDANTGIYMRCADVKNITDRTCYEANVFDQRPEPIYGTGAIVHVSPVSPMPKAGGKWNTYDITVEGQHLTVTLNGVVTAHVQDSKLASGPIALQYAAGVVKFRKVQIAEL